VDIKPRAMTEYSTNLKHSWQWFNRHLFHGRRRSVV